MSSKHDEVCIKNNPGCPCLTCRRDDGCSECCSLRHPRSCSDCQPCDGYYKEVTFHAEE